MNIINGLIYVMFELSTRIFYREFQALQLIFLALLGAVDLPRDSYMLFHFLEIILKL